MSTDDVNPEDAESTESLDDAHQRLNAGHQAEADRLAAIVFVASPDFPPGADEQVQLEDQLPADRDCACVTDGEWTPTDQCALRPHTRCTAGAPVWVAFQSGGPDAAAERIAQGDVH